MIYSLKGTLIHTEANAVVIECAGVGYKCNVTTQTAATIGATGTEVQLFTYLYVKEDIVDLYGFKTKAEQDAFKQLITVSGVGPKAAIAILSELTPEKLALAIATSDAKAISRAKGVGAKLAQKVILELKDKISNDDVAKGITAKSSSVDINTGSVAEAISALTVLGYSQSDAVEAVSKLDASLSSQELIKGALKLLSRN
ncbi:MAG: Holliday junction branch migration protein RuvA [Oscillospiraceae bacterium]|nr:Holliday junction branch migration protein RuvA [Oscillospiraceae bacterium]